jgi:imidazolonepropionase-like amidohydrolase
MFKFLLATLVLLAASCATVPRMTTEAGPALVIRGARVFDGDKSIAGVDVLVQGEHIAALGHDLAVPAGAEVIDAQGMTLLPAFIDAHVHVWSEDALKQSAVMGVVTVLDMGVTAPDITGHLKQMAAVKNSGLADVRYAGYAVTCPGGHGTEYPGPPVPTVSGPQDAEPFVQKLVEQGADYIKIIYTAGLDLPPGIKARFPSISKETMAAAVAAAHRHGKLAVVHINALQGARDAIEAGADALVHLFNDKMPDPGFAELAKQHHLFVVPTLSVITCEGAAGARLVEDEAVSAFVGPEATANLKASFPRRKGRSCDDTFAEAAVRGLSQAGVPLLAGTDAPNPGTSWGVTVHGELERLVHAGLPPTAALAAATSVAAKAFGLADRGRIAPGQRADLLLVRGDPASDIRSTRAIVRVWKAGRPIDRDSFKAAVAAEKQQALSQTSPAPLGAEVGVVSDFDSGQIDARFGAGWAITTDAIRGGKSNAKMGIHRGGAAGSTGSLEVGGNVATAAFPWAGVMFSPGTQAFAPANLSQKHALVFEAKGDGATYSLLVFTQSSGLMPAVQTFAAESEWKRYQFTLADFNTQGKDITGIAFVATVPGSFNFQIDQVEFK